MTSAPDLAPARLLGVARGFACLFWGLAMVVLLTTGLLRVNVLDSGPLPRLTPALLLILGGAIQMRRMAALTPAWRGRSFSLLTAVLAQCYLLPFSLWWLQAPHLAFFGANMAAYVLATAWMLLAANLLAGEMGRAMANPVLVIESRLCGWSVLILAALLLSVAQLDDVREIFLYPLLAGKTPGLYTGASGRACLLLQGMICLPFLLTMATVWEARSEALSALARGHRKSVDHPGA